MKRSLRQLGVSVLLAAAAACTHLPVDVPGPVGADPFQAERQILVTIRQTNSAALTLVGTPDSRYRRRRDYGPAPAVERSLARIADAYALARVRGWSIAAIDAYCEVLEAPAGADIDALLSALRAEPGIDVAQRMNLFETQSSRYDDPYVDLQTSVGVLGIEPAHAVATGRGVKVAVVDSGIELRHPDLRRNVRSSWDLVRAAGGAGTGEVHGTAVAGIIAAAAGNREGIVGIAPNAEIAALRACWSVTPDGSAAARCSSFSLALALEAALELDVDIINLSLSGPDDPLLGALLDEALARGIVVVAAAGAPNRSFPASHRGVVVASAGEPTDGAMYPFELIAPGREVLTTTTQDGYAFFSGNSMSAAHVSGIVALLRERHRKLDAGRIVDLLIETRRPDGVTSSIDVCRALSVLEGDNLCRGETQAIARAGR